MRSEIDRQMRAIVAQQLVLDVDSIPVEARFAEDLGADSLAVTEIVLAIEEVFGVEVPEAACAELRTVRDAADYVAGRLRGAPNKNLSRLRHLGDPAP